MDVFEAVRTLLAVRQFKAKPVPDDVVHKIVEAGRLTGSAMNKQPWHFVVVTERERLRELAGAATTGPYIAGAAFAIVVAVERGRYAATDGSRAIQSMVLAAWGEGVGSNLVGSGFEEAKKLLGVPKSHDVIAIVPFGYPARPGKGGKKERKPLGEVASRERYGTPFA